MQNQKVKNIIILLAVVLIGFMIFFYSSKPKEVVNNNEITENQEEVLSNEQNEEDEQSVVLTPDNTLTSQEINTKFNTAMSNASNAFIKADYNLAISYYNEALSYKKYEGTYAGLYNVYLTQKQWLKALDAINNAININPLLGDYWKWKILVLDEGMKSNFSELKKVYDEGYPKVKTEEKINLITYFARLAGNKGYKSDAISAWQKAIELNPGMKAVYQAEIDALK